ncbi:MAG: thermonuclease family protein [Deltaproteobacteria bacterium]|nr:thermonuclease family protein [Deltaproteobacteria bacterium]
MKKNILTLIVFFAVLIAGVYQYSASHYQQPLTRDSRPAADFIEADVVKVIDGDTIEIKNGERVRYIGIDTPEIDQIFYQEAKDRNNGLVYGKKVRLVLCKSQPRDKYGRLLAWVYVDDIFVNAALLKEGYAKILTIPPCGVEKEDEFKNYEKEAAQKRLGLWAKDGRLLDKSEEAIPAGEANRYIGKTKTVRGKVLNVFDSGKAIFLNFGEDYKKDFTVVIFRKNIKEFEQKGIDPFNFYKGKEILVTGKIKEYNGPEIVANDPSQIEIR